MITKRTYFKGDIQIANATDTAPSSNLIGNAKELDYFIARYDREALVHLLGLELYNEFKLQFDVGIGGWTLKPTADPKWKDLLNGSTYTYNGKPQYWSGLIYSDTDGVPDTSIMAYYIYSKFIEADELRHTGVGFAKDQAQNANVQLGRSKWAFAYNEFVKMSHDLRYFITVSNRMTPNTYIGYRSKCFEYVNRFGL